MGDMETTVDDVTTDVDTEIDTTDDSGDVTDERVALFNKYKIDPETASTDDLYNVLQRLTKAEQLKREAKSKKVESSEPAVKFITEAYLERRDFLKANPELSEYTKDWEQKVKSGYTFEDAKDSVLKSDKARANREKVNSLGLSDGESTTEKSTITKAELAKIAEKNPKEYNRLRDLMDSGKLTMK